MRNVMRTALTSGAMLMGIGAAAAQAPVPRPAVFTTEAPPIPLAAQAMSPVDVVIGRLMSFDRNADHRISRSELPERMQGLVARGDRNADAALDSDEISSLRNAPSSARIPVSFRSQSSEGLPGVIKDLKLPPTKQERALGILAGHPQPGPVNGPTGSDLYRKMRALLDDEEYGNFVAAAARLSRSPRIGGVGSGIVK
jgi:hypothetical protein